MLGKKQEIEKLINEYCGCPSRLKKELSKLGCNYVVRTKNIQRTYIVRPINRNGFKHTIVL